MSGTRCPSCGTTNPEAQRFCGSCGASLTRACSSCGEVNPAASDFCGSCGARLPDAAPAAPRREERRIATVLFADLSGFTSISERLDPEDVKALGAHLSRQMGDQVATFGGTLVSVLGDAIMAVFGAPIAHEDDAERAVRCALAIRDSTTSPDGSSVPVALHIGINTGEVMAGIVGTDEHAEYTVMGDVTNTAARLQSAAASGQILVGAATHAATRETIEYEPVPAVVAKGKERPVPAWAAIDARARPAEPRPSRSLLVGRDQELDLLERLWEQVVSAARPHLATVIGDPGIGKSRLVREFQSRLGTGVRALKGRNLPYGEATGYDAFAEQVRSLATIADGDPAPEGIRKLEACVSRLMPNDAAAEVAQHLAILLGLSAEGSPDQQALFASVRSFVAALGRDAPTLLVFEDLHWAPSSLLSLLEVLAMKTREAPVLVLTTARPEFLDTRPSWGGGLPRYHALHLEPLDESSARFLAEALLGDGREGADEAASEAVDRLIHTGGGNPLFLEEFAAALAERSSPTGSGVPPTVQSIISARIDALPQRDRGVLQDASVLGRVFGHDTLAAVHAGTDLDDALDSLESRDLIRRQPGPEGTADQVFIFKHILTAEVAYQTLPRAARRSRHAAAASHLEASAGDRLREEAALIAYHLERADDPQRAVPYLLMAADAAARTWAKERAIGLYGEVLEIVGDDADDAVVDEALLGRTRALLSENDFGEIAVGDLDRLMTSADATTRALAFELRARLAYWTGDADGTRAFAEEAVAGARVASDAAIEARSIGLLGEVRAMAGNLDEAESLSVRGVSMWPEGARDGTYAYTCALLGLIHYWRGRYEEAIRWSETGYTVGVAASHLGATLHSAEQGAMALAGSSRHEEALEMIERAVVLGGEWEPKPQLTSRAINIKAGILREIGDLAAARSASQDADELARSATFPGARISSGIDLLVLDTLEGDVGGARQRLPDLLEAAEQTKGWHQWLFAGRLAEAGARIQLLSGDAEAAVDAASVALERARHHGRLKYACRSRLVLGDALLATGRRDEAETAFEEAVREAERLGHAPSSWAALFGLARALDALGRDADAEIARSRAEAAVEAFASSLSQERRPAFRALVTPR